MAVHVGGRGPGHKARVTGRRGSAFAGATLAALKDTATNAIVDQSGNTLVGQDATIWGSTAAKDIAAAQGFKFGAAFSISEYTGSAAYATLLRAFCTHYGPANDMKPSVVQGTQGVFDFTAADAFAAQAAADGKTFRLHLLHYPAHDMPWVDGTTVTGASWKGLIDAHFAAVAARSWAQSVTSIDVTNEVMTGGASPGYRSTPWFDAAAANPFTVPGYSQLSTAGGTYVTYCFYKARQLWPGTPLYLCHDATEQQSQTFFQQEAANILAMLSVQIAAGAPIDGVNLQGHLRFSTSGGALTFDPLLFRNFLASIRALGLKIIVGEMDSRTGNNSPYVAANYSTTELDRQNAELVKRYLDIVLPYVDGGEFLTWGASDTYQAWEANERPLPYDTSNAAKPMLTSIRNAFMGL